MVSVCVRMARASVVSGVSLHEGIFGYFQERRIPDDPVSCMADFCRLSEFLYLSFKLSGSTV